MTSPTPFFRRARRAHKLVIGALGLAVLFLVVNVALAFGQWDRSPRSFRAGSSIEVRLEQGDERIVYLGANESELLFEVNPGDFDCQGRAPTGPARDLERTRGDRLLDVWREHSAVATLVADMEGTYVVSCDGREDAELLLASPARFTVGWASPLLALWLVGIAVIVGGVTLLVGAVVRTRGRRRDKVIAGGS